MIERIAIIGTGLIGGSLGLCWKRLPDAPTIVGYDRPEILEEALHRQAIDEAAPSLKEAVAHADMILLATPVRTIPELLTRISPWLTGHPLITDVGSVKAPLLTHAQQVLPSHASFYGGHPMAGAEKGGIQHADPFLFENATYVLCPPPHPHPNQQIFFELLEQTGARLLFLEAQEHDHIAAWVSHLPQLLAVSMTYLASEKNKNNPAFLQLAAGGFRDITRIATSPFEIWKDILQLNREHLLNVIKEFITQLQVYQEALEKDQIENLSTFFDQAREARAQIPKNTKGFLTPLADVFLYAQDKPGFLLRMSQVLFEAGLNIKDIELLKIREGIEGAFRISFATEEEAEKAVCVLNQSGFRAYR